MHITQKQFFNVAVFIAVIISYLSILRSPLLYCDDALRGYTYLAIDQGVHGRPLADIVYLFIAGGLFIDFSPMSQILAIACIVAAAFLLYECIFENVPKNEGYNNIERCVFVLVFSVFPLNYSLISFRFDSLSFGLAALFASVAFAKAIKVKIHCLKDVRYLLIPGLFLASSLALYQVMFGIYACCAVFYLCNMLLNNDNFSIVVNRLLSTISVCVVSVLCYLPVIYYSKYMLQFDHYGLGPHSYAKFHSELPSILKFPHIVFKNICIVFSTLKSYLDMNVLSIILFLAIFVFIAIVLTQKIDVFRKIIVLLALPCALVVCFGLQIFLVNPTIETRTFATSATFVACLFGCILKYVKIHFIKKYLFVVFGIFILSSSVVLSAIGNAQRDQFNFESQIVYNGLEADLMNLYVSNGLRSFYITPWQPSTCTTLQVLQQKYSFLKSGGAMSVTAFFMHKMTSDLPISYYLKSFILPPTDFSKLPTVIDKYNYSIKQVESGRFVIILKDIMVPPFTPERWK